MDKPSKNIWNVYAPQPHRRLQQYLSLKLKVDKCVELNKSSFLEYCDNLVKEGGKGALYKLFKYGPDRDYDDHCSSAAAFDCSGNDNNEEELGGREHEPPSTTPGNNFTLMLRQHNQQEPQNVAREEQSLLPSVDAVKRRLSDYVINNMGLNMTTYAELFKKSIPFLIDKYQSLYKYLYKYCPSSIIEKKKILMMFNNKKILATVSSFIAVFTLLCTPFPRPIRFEKKEEH